MIGGGVAGVSPAEGVAQDTGSKQSLRKEACAQGKAFPSYSTSENP